ncbi:MAG: hypothetical protein H6742_11840 [Alphaproteobacteria bacterium]|nr:hypothetical protein [Alphaproteobacteria bacterium]
MHTSSSDDDLRGADPGASSARQRALDALPPPLQADLDDPAVLRVRQDGLDDTVITLLRVEPQADFVYLQRVVWCFDEQLTCWRVDSNELWELPDQLATQLAAQLAGPGGGDRGDTGQRRADH